MSDGLTNFLIVIFSICSICAAWAVVWFFPVILEKFSLWRVGRRNLNLIEEYLASNTKINRQIDMYGQQVITPEPVATQVAYDMATGTWIGTSVTTGQRAKFTNTDQILELLEDAVQTQNPPRDRTIMWEKDNG